MGSSSLGRELWAILTVYLGTVIGGLSMGLSAVVVPDILREQEVKLSGNQTSYFAVIQADNEDLSWFASSVNIGQMFGCLLGGYCGGRFGPKKTMMFFSVPCILSWLGMAFSPNLGILIASRVISGVCSSVNTSNCSLLVAQYSSTPRRGAFLSVFALMVGLGVLLAYCLGAGLAWRWVCLGGPVLLIVFVASLATIPESPIWLLGHRGEEETRTALKWLRASENVDEELEELALTREKQTQGLTFTQALINLRRPDIYRPFLLITTNFLFVMGSGPFAVIFYGVQIFQKTGINAYLAAICVAIIRVVGGVLAIFLIKNIPRVRLVMMTMTLMSVSMAVLGGVIYLQDQGADSPFLRVLPVICVLIYMFGFGAGSGPLQWVFMGELLPPDYKVLSGMMVSISTIALFTVTKIFPTLVDSSIGASGAYWLFSGVALLSNVFYVTLMPETKGMTMLEIRNMFRVTK